MYDSPNVLVLLRKAPVILAIHKTQWSLKQWKGSLILRARYICFYLNSKEQFNGSDTIFFSSHNRFHTYIRFQTYVQVVLRRDVTPLSVRHYIQEDAALPVLGHHHTPLYCLCSTSRWPWKLASQNIAPGFRTASKGTLLQTLQRTIAPLSALHLYIM
jgi:hypothetical protein